MNQSALKYHIFDSYLYNKYDYPVTISWFVLITQDKILLVTCSAQVHMSQISGLTFFVCFSLL